MKSSAVLCLVLLTVIFASSVKFSAGFPSAAAEKISDDLKTFEDMRSLPCVDEKDEYYCLYEIAIEESCDFKPLTMMKECRFSCSFCRL